MKNIKRLESESIGKLLWRLSVPASVGFVVNALYNLVDRFFISRGCGREAVAGVTLAFPVMMVLIALGMLIGVGSGAVVSIKLGEHDKTGAEQVLGQCVVLKFLTFLTVPFVILFFLDDLLPFFGATTETLGYARDYLRIILWGNVLAHLTFGLSNVMRSEGNAFFSMKCMILGAGLNIILDPIFIFVLKMGVAGAAWATNLALLGACLYALYHFTRGQSSIRLRWANLRLYRATIWKVLAIGLSPFVIHVMGSLVNISYNRAFLKWTLGTSEATVQIAAMGIINSVTFLLLMPVFGLSQGLQPIAGYSYGAQQYDRLRQAYVLSMQIATGMCLLIMLTVFLMARPIAQAFSDDLELIEASVRGMRLFCSAFVLIGAPITTVTYFQSVGRPTLAIMISLLRQAVILIPLIFLMPYLGGVTGIWLAAPASDLGSALIAGVLIYRELALIKDAKNQPV